MREILSNCRNAVCEVKTMENEFLAMGVVDDIIFGQNTVVDIKSTDTIPFFELPLGLPVKIAIKRSKDFIIVGGFSYGTNGRIWRINKVTEYKNIERRSFFRVKTKAFAKIMKQGQEDVPSLIQPINSLSYVATLMDVSLSGIRFSSLGRLNPGEKIEINNLMLAKGLSPINFTCLVIDVRQASVRVSDNFENSDIGEHTINLESLKTEREGYIYRCKIDDIDPISVDILAKSILALEKENLKKRQQRIQ